MMTVILSKAMSQSEGGGGFSFSGRVVFILIAPGDTNIYINYLTDSMDFNDLMTKSEHHLFRRKYSLFRLDNSL